jgi:hypothetical protein
MARKAGRASSDLVRSVALIKRKPQEKRRRTLFLNDDTFRRLQAYCAREDLSVSEVVDAWVREFLERVEF